MSTAPTTRRIVSVESFGGPERLLQQVVEEREPVAGELLVDVEAAGVNYIDVYQRSGTYPVPLPLRPGWEGVGRIRAQGDESGAFAIGQRVAWIDVPGSYASALVVPVAKAIAVPDSLALPQCLLFQAITAHYLVTEYRRIGPGDRVLVHAAAGGVGLLLVQWCRHLGATVFGTTSSDRKGDRAKAAGAAAVINYGKDYAFLDALMAMTDGRGVDLAFDAVGAGTLENTLKALSRGGTAVLYGSASGPSPAILPSSLIQRGLRLAGGSVFGYTAEPVELRSRASAVVDGIAAGWLDPGTGTAYRLADASDAHRDIEGRETTGKLYLTP